MADLKPALYRKKDIDDKAWQYSESKSPEDWDIVQPLYTKDQLQSVEKVLLTHQERDEMRAFFKELSGNATLIEAFLVLQNNKLPLLNYSSLQKRFLPDPDTEQATNVLYEYEFAYLYHARDLAELDTLIEVQHEKAWYVRSKEQYTNANNSGLYIDKPFYMYLEQNNNFDKPAYQSTPNKADAHRFASKELAERFTSHWTEAVYLDIDINEDNNNA